MMQMKDGKEAEMATVPKVDLRRAEGTLGCGDALAPGLGAALAAGLCDAAGLREGSRLAEGSGEALRAGERLAEAAGDALAPRLCEGAGLADALVAGLREGLARAFGELLALGKALRDTLAPAGDRRPGPTQSPAAPRNQRLWLSHQGAGGQKGSG
jgi:hypothetical protein